MPRMLRRGDRAGLPAEVTIPPSGVGAAAMAVAAASSEVLVVLVAVEPSIGNDGNETAASRSSRCSADAGASVERRRRQTWPSVGRRRTRGTRRIVCFWEWNLWAVVCSQHSQEKPQRRVLTA